MSRMRLLLQKSRLQKVTSPEIKVNFYLPNSRLQEQRMREWVREGGITERGREGNHRMCDDDDDEGGGGGFYREQISLNKINNDSYLHKITVSITLVAAGVKLG